MLTLHIKLEYYLQKWLFLNESYKRMGELFNNNLQIKEMHIEQNCVLQILRLRSIFLLHRSERSTFHNVQSVRGSKFPVSYTE